MKSWLISLLVPNVDTQWTNRPLGSGRKRQRGSRGSPGAQSLATALAPYMTSAKAMLVAISRAMAMPAKQPTARSHNHPQPQATTNRWSSRAAHEARARRTLRIGNIELTSLQHIWWGGVGDRGEGLHQRAQRADGGALRMAARALISEAVASLETRRLWSAHMARRLVSHECNDVLGRKLLAVMRRANTDFTSSTRYILDVTLPKGLAEAVRTALSSAAAAQRALEMPRVRNVAGDTVRIPETRGFTLSMARATPPDLSKMLLAIQSHAQEDLGSLPASANTARAQDMAGQALAIATMAHDCGPAHESPEAVIATAALIRNFTEGNPPVETPVGTQVSKTVPGSAVQEMARSCLQLLLPEHGPTADYVLQYGIQAINAHPQLLGQLAAAAEPPKSLNTAVIGAPATRFATRPTPPQVRKINLGHEHQLDDFCGQHAISSLLGGGVLSPFTACALKAWALRELCLREAADAHHFYQEETRGNLPAMRAEIQTRSPLNPTLQAVACLEASAKTLSQDTASRDATNADSPTRGDTNMLVALSPRHMVLILDELLRDATGLTTSKVILYPPATHGCVVQTGTWEEHATAAQASGALPGPDSPPGSTLALLVGNDEGHWTLLVWSASDQRYLHIDSCFDQVERLPQADLPRTLNTLKATLVVSVSMHANVHGGAAASGSEGANQAQLGHLQATARGNLPAMLQSLSYGSLDGPPCEERVPCLAIGEHYLCAPATALCCDGSPEPIEMILLGKTLLLDRLHQPEQVRTGGMRERFENLLQPMDMVAHRVAAKQSSRWTLKGPRFPMLHPSRPPGLEDPPEATTDSAMEWRSASAPARRPLAAADTPLGGKREKSDRRRNRKPRHKDRRSWGSESSTESSSDVDFRGPRTRNAAGHGRQKQKRSEHPRTNQKGRHPSQKERATQDRASHDREDRHQQNKYQGKPDDTSRVLAAALAALTAVIQPRTDRGHNRSSPERTSPPRDQHHGRTSRRKPDTRRYDERQNKPPAYAKKRAAHKPKEPSAEAATAKRSNPNRASTRHTGATDTVQQELRDLKQQLQELKETMLASMQLRADGPPPDRRNNETTLLPPHLDSSSTMDSVSTSGVSTSSTLPLPASTPEAADGGRHLPAAAAGGGDNGTTHPNSPEQTLPQAQQSPAGDTAHTAHPERTPTSVAASSRNGETSAAWGGRRRSSKTLPPERPGHTTQGQHPATTTNSECGHTTASRITAETSRAPTGETGNTPMRSRTPVKTRGMSRSATAPSARMPHVGPPQPRSLGLKPTSHADLPLGRSRNTQGLNRRRMRSTWTASVGYLNTNKRLMAATEAAKESRAIWASLMKLLRLEALMCTETEASNLSWATICSAFTRCNFLCGASASLPSGEANGSGRHTGSAAGGTHTLARYGTSNTPYRGSFGACIWYQCIKLRRGIPCYAWSVYCKPNTRAESLHRFMDSIMPIIDTQHKHATVLLGGDLNIRNTSPPTFQGYQTVDNVAPSARLTMIWGRLREDGWLPIPHNGSPFPTTFQARGKDHKSQPDHAFIMKPRQGTAFVAEVQIAPPLRSGHPTSDHHMIVVTVTGPTSQQAVAPSPHKPSRPGHHTRLPQPSHILWDTFRSTSAAQEAARPQDLALLAQAFFRGSQPTSTALPTEFSAAQAARKARIKAWKTYAKAKTLQNEQSEQGSSSLQAELRKLCVQAKRLWRAVKRKYRKRCHQIRRDVRMGQAVLDISRRPSTTAVDAPSFLAHQRSIMCAGSGEIQPHVSPAPADIKTSYRPFTSAECAEAIRKLQCGKAAGIDDIPAELAKACPEHFIRHVVRTANKALSESEWPDLWATARGHPIPKGSTSTPTDPSTYRLIAVLPTEAKIATYMILNRLKKAIGHHIPQQQTGFAPHTRVELAVSGTSAFIAAAKSQGKPVLASTVDIKKAFDTVDRGLLLGKLEHAGTPPDILFALRSYFGKTRVQLPGGTIHYKRGVVQGCVLSPLLFALYTASLAKCAEPADDGAEQVLFLYADDVLLLSTSASKHASTLRKLVTETNNLLLEVHPSKCHTLVIGRRESQRDALWTELQQELHPTVGHLFRERATGMTYLGYALSENGPQPGSEKRRKQASTKAQQIRAVAQKRNLSPRQASLLCKTYVLPLLDWGHTVPTPPEGRAAPWAGLDDCDDRIAAIAFAGTTFGALTDSPQRRIPGHILCEAVDIKPARERRGNLAAGLRTHIYKLNEAHPVSRCLAHNQRTLQQGTSSTLKLLGLRHDQRAAARTHASSRAWASAAALHGTCHEALAGTAHHEARQACLKLRCNTNTYLPGDALRMGNVYPSKLCQHPACLLACDNLEHKAFSCSQATAARLRSETLRAIRSELDLYKVGSTGAEPLAVFRAAAMGDHRCLNRLFQHSISADKRRRLNSALSSLAWKTIGRIMLIARDNPLQLGLHHLEDPVAGGAAAGAGAAL